MKQLKIKNLKHFIREIESCGVPISETDEMPIYLGNDEELNDIHTCYFIEAIDPDDPENEDIKEMINSDFANAKITGMSILIS